MKVGVVGGGNIGTQFACVCAFMGYEVNIYSSKPEKYDGQLEIVDEYEKVIIGKISIVSDDIEEVVSDCDIVFVTYPAFLLKKAASMLLPFVTEKMSIGVIPGTGGAEFAFLDCIRAGATLFGLQRVPAVARLEKYGKRVRCEGLRDKLFLATIPSNKASELSHFISSLFGIPCEVLPNYLSVTLTPSNPILHTTRLRTLFADYVKGKVYSANPLFYGEWNDKSSELLLACDKELQKICGLLNGLDLSNVRSLKLHYESDTIEAMTNKLSSIKSLHNLKSPMKKVEKGWVPDFQSRYFMADFPCGLAIIESIAGLLHFTAPNIEETINWYRMVTGDCARFDLESYGIRTVEDLYLLYKDKSNGRKLTEE